MLLILVASLRESGEKVTLEAILRKLPEAVREQILSIKPPHRQYGTALGRLMLQELLLDWGYPAGMLTRLQKNQYGKPHFEGTPFFSISHSADLVICAASRTGPVGVDAEKITGFDQAGMHIFFIPEEWAQIQAGPPETFLRFWTRKESVIKADGRGVSLPLEKINVLADRLFLPGNSQEWHLSEFIPESGYCAAVCTSIPLEEKPVIQRYLPDVL